MFIFGEFKKIENKAQLEEVLLNAKNACLDFSEISIEDILHALDHIGKQWEKGGKWYQKALEVLPQELSFSSDMIQKTLELIPDLLSYQTLFKRVSVELGNVSSLDKLVERPGYDGKLRCFPIGTLLHVSAGNIFLGCIDSLLMGFLTKNINILKLSSRNQTFPRLFAESILENSQLLSDKFAILYWKGGNTAYEDIVKKNVNGIIAWGGEEMLNSYKKNLPLDVKLIDYGPKISIQVLTKKYFDHNSIEDVAKRIVSDVSLWDQSACAAAQNLFVEDGVDLNSLMTALDDAFKSFEIKRGTLSADEHVDILKEKFRAEYSYLQTKIDYIQGDEYFIHFDPDLVLRPSPLNRTLIIKPYKMLNDLKDALQEFRFYLQTCGLGVATCERDDYIQRLGMAGIMRFTELGKMLQSTTGAPHDGRFGLTELVHTVSYESQYMHEEELEKFLMNASKEIAYYQEYQGKKIGDFPLMDGHTLAQHGPATKQPRMIASKSNGLVFASGGTTGQPKFSLYSSREFEKTSRLLGESYMQAGLCAGDIVANLFVAGNMWSSFSAVQLALQHCPVLQLPIGGKIDVKDLKTFLETFRPNVVFGLPGMLLDLAQQLSELEADIRIEKVFYAGEMLKDSTIDSLKSMWGVEKFISAGYASVDVGPIGYQVPNAKEGEHYLFKHIYPEIIEGELVVTSTLRESMPIIRYKTGDRVRLLEIDEMGQKIQLLGRIDSLLQLWGCRFSINDIEKALNQLDQPFQQFQIVLEYEKNKGEVLKVLVEAPLLIIDHKYFCHLLYESCSDLQQTIDFDFLLKHVEIKA